MPLKLQAQRHHQPKPRRLTPCHRHPDQPLTPLCAPCLRERLSLLDPSSSSASGDGGPGPTASSSSSSAAALPELRRCKTFSGDKCEGLGLAYEPRRRSCEVKACRTLEDLFTDDDEGGGAGSSVKRKVESKNLGLLKGPYPDPELREEEDEESDWEIRVSADVILPNAVTLRDSDLNVDEGIEDSKTIKEFIDLEYKSNKPVRRDFKEIAGSFWIAASVFSRKLQIWKRKQKSGKPDDECDRGRRDGGHVLGEMRLERLRGRRLRDTTSEVGEYGFGRRSCDTDPRFSIDLGRASVDGGRIFDYGIVKRIFDSDPRCSLDLGIASVDCGGIKVEEGRQGCFDAPRASWDGYMNGRACPRGSTSMVSVIENATATLYGFDNRAMAAEKLNVENVDRKSFGGARNMDSVLLSMRSEELDQSNPKRNVMLSHEEDGEAQLLCHNEKLHRDVEIFHGTKLLITEKELMDSRMSSLRDDSSDSFDTTSKDMTSSASSSSNGTGSKESRKWGKFLNVWGLLSQQKQRKSAEEEEFDGRNVECSIDDPLKKIEREGNGEEVNSNLKWKLVRSHSVTSSRSLYTVAGSTLGMNGETEAKSLSLNLKRREADVFERNRSARYSPNNVNNGMLRFYLTPLRSSRRSKYGKSRLNKSHSLARAALKL